MGQTEPQFLSDPMSDRKKKFLPTLILSELRFLRKVVPLSDSLREYTLTKKFFV
jgi:hypothetical protein